HFAVLVPSRVELAHSLQRLVETDTVMQGFADHGVSEALYLADPDGNGIEIYRDRPRADWPFAGGRLRMGTDPLDVDDLLREVQGAPNSGTGLAEGTRFAQVHFPVPPLPKPSVSNLAVLESRVLRRSAGRRSSLPAAAYHLPP